MKARALLLLLLVVLPTTLFNSALEANLERYSQNTSLQHIDVE